MKVFMSDILVLLASGWTWQEGVLRLLPREGKAGSENVREV